MNRAIRNVLLVVEGDKEEHRLVDVLFNTLIHEAEWKIYTYGTVIHELIRRINDDYDGDFENIEIRKVLAEMLPDSAEATRDMLLCTRFTDVILMFDFDPQDDRMDIEGLRTMVSIFNDSSDTDRGLLLINYPAIESVKETAALPYDVFLKSYTNREALKTYKQDVNQTVSKYPGHYNDFRDYGAKPLTKAIAYTVGKIQYVLDNRQMEKTFPYMHSESLSDICWSIPLLRLLDYQIEEYKSNGKIAACGTGPFFVAAWKKSLDGAWKAFFGD
jgi:hypothetical protein